MQQSKTVDEYIQLFPEKTQEILQKIRKIVKDNVSHGEESISYGVPTVKLNGKYVVYFAGFKTHISIYPVFDSLEKTLPEIGQYRKGKGTLQFPLEKPVPYPLINNIVKLLLQENLKRGLKK